MLHQQLLYFSQISVIKFEIIKGYSRHFKLRAPSIARPVNWTIQQQQQIIKKNASAPASVPRYLSQRELELLSQIYYHEYTKERYYSKQVLKRNRLVSHVTLYASPYLPNHPQQRDLKLFKKIHYNYLPDLLMQPWKVQTDSLPVFEGKFQMTPSRL